MARKSPQSRAAASPAAPRLLKISEACVLLNVSESKVRTLLDGRKLPFYKLDGAIRIDEADVLDYIATCYQPATGTLAVEVVEPERKKKAPAAAAGGFKHLRLGGFVPSFETPSLGKKTL